ncbi:MAG: hypothetical protein J0I32_01370 [Sphingobacteriales bacterium]|nr:hypothetical protein [Sphingobacteriales bacterium]OJW04690.1 MAG: hypothetical protein BGO52_19465 [Sphingobacteriales bacterium 44-61]
MAQKKKLPADTNKKAKSVVDLATGEASEVNEDGKNAAAVALGRRGGLKGGKARAAALTPKRRAEIAKKAAATRWKKKKDDK